ncbi:MAG: hypothetical protein ACLQG3_08280 [Terracidiphilus sp.]
MTANSKTNDLPAARPAAHAQHDSGRVRLLRNPGLIASSVYMLMLAAITVMSVMKGRIGPVSLVLAVLFVAGALGLLMLFRWGWALTVAAAALSAAMFLLSYFTQHSPSALEQGLISLVVFLYLVRANVREKLR